MLSICTRNRSVKLRLGILSQCPRWTRSTSAARRYGPGGAWRLGSRGHSPHNVGTEDIEDPTSCSTEEKGVKGYPHWPTMFVVFIFTWLLTLIILVASSDPLAGDLTNNGNYKIWRCGKNISGGRADQLISLLQEIGNDLPTIVVDANQGTDSQYGYQAFFKTNDNIPFVTDTFGKMSDSASVNVGGQEQQVVFVCANPGDPVVATVYNNMMATQPRAAAYSAFGNNAIYLFPFFWALSRKPYPFRCPHVRNGICSPNSDYLGRTQYATIVHELADKYLHLNDMNAMDVYNIQDCIDLPANEQIDNAENYAMYVSGE